MSTPGVDESTLNKVNLGWFDIASNRLLSQKFIYPKKKRVYISKVSSDEKRPLTLATPRIKIIERAILNVIEPFFEGVWG